MGYLLDTNIISAWARRSHPALMRRMLDEDADGEIGRGDGEHARHERGVAAASPGGDDAGVEQVAH